MFFYYGSKTLVQKPIYNYGNPSNDYGIGFYLTPDKNIARLWASKNPDGGYLLTYSLDLDGLSVLHLDESDEYGVLQWISILISHRFSLSEKENNIDSIKWLTSKFKIDEDSYDAIIGYRADDSYFNYSREFVKNNLSLETLSKAMKLGKLGIQVVLKSIKAFEKIKLIDSEKVEHTSDYDNFRYNVLKEYNELREKEDINNTFLRDIMRKYN